MVKKGAFYRKQEIEEAVDLVIENKL